jgi:hypothetical protein
MRSLSTRCAYSIVLPMEICHGAPSYVFRALPWQQQGRCLYVGAPQIIQAGIELSKSSVLSLWARESSSSDLCSIVVKWGPFTDLQQLYFGVLVSRLWVVAAWMILACARNLPLTNLPLLLLLNCPCRCNDPQSKQPMAFFRKLTASPQLDGSARSTVVLLVPSVNVSGCWVLMFIQREPKIW